MRCPASPRVPPVHRNEAKAWLTMIHSAWLTWGVISAKAPPVAAMSRSTQDQPRLCLSRV